MKKKSIKLLVVLACVLMALGMAGCGKKAYKTFPEKYKLASVDVGGMTADEAKKAIKTAVGKYKISVKLDDASFDMTAKDLGLKYNDKADLQELINAANKDKKPEKQEKLFQQYILYRNRYPAKFSHQGLLFLPIQWFLDENFHKMEWFFSLLHHIPQNDGELYYL